MAGEAACAATSLCGFQGRLAAVYRRGRTFSSGFHLAANPRGVSDSRSRAYIGIGAFQLVKRTAYQACGTHERLRMEVLDDMKLAKIVKQAGFRSGVAIAQKFVAV